MLCYDILNWTILSYPVLYCIILILYLWNATIYYIMLCYTILDDTIRCYIIFYYAMVRSAMPCQWCHATLHWTTWSSPTLPYCYTRCTLCWNMLYCIVIYRSSGVTVASPALPKSLLVISSCHTQLTYIILYVAVLYGILFARWRWPPIAFKKMDLASHLTRWYYYTMIYPVLLYCIVFLFKKMTWHPPSPARRRGWASTSHRSY